MHFGETNFLWAQCCFRFLKNLCDRDQRVRNLRLIWNHGMFLLRKWQFIKISNLKDRRLNLLKWLLGQLLLFFEAEVAWCFRVAHYNTWPVVFNRGNQHGIRLLKQVLLHLCLKFRGHMLINDCLDKVPLYQVAVGYYVAHHYSHIQNFVALKFIDFLCAF